MDPLVRATVHLQRVLGRFGALAFVALASLLFVYGARTERTGLTAAVAGLLLFGMAAGTFVRHLRNRDKVLVSGLELTLFASILGLAYVSLVYLPEGLRAAAHPLILILTMIGSAHTRLSGTLILLLFAGSLEVGLGPLLGVAPGLAPLLVRLSFLAVFAALSRMLYERELRRVNRVAQKQVQDELGRLKEDARAYRLVGGADSEERALETGALEVARAVDFALLLLRSALRLQSASFYSESARGKLTLRGASSSGELRTEIAADTGIFAVSIERREFLSLVGARRTAHTPVYQRPELVGALALVPVMGAESLLGVLYVDRSEESEFSEGERELLRRTAEFVKMTTENERVFSRLEKQTREQTKLYRAAEALGSAQSEMQVIEAGVESARTIASFDFAAVTLFHRKTGTHEICAVSGGQSEHLVGQKFRQNAGLVSMAVANKQALPYRGDYDAERQILFSRGQEVKEMPSLLVLPLLLHERVLGTLVLGSRQRGVFRESVRPALEVLARHMAVSLSNARMVRRLEEQATTDGLTGLLNKRALIAAAERRIKMATRFQRPLSILVTDIDFFKKVNDTYGHDVGDVVIKGLGDVLRGMQRDTDAIGRFGGEEFVFVCEQTDEEGAQNLAERIRKELEATTFQTELGPLKVTCSIGTATFPAAGKDWETLFKATDEALYVSKRTGRNRVTSWKPRMKGTSAA